MSMTKLLICAISIAAAVAATRASGQNYSAHLVAITPSLVVNGTLNDGEFRNYTSGVNQFSDFAGFCVDPTQGIAPGETLIYQVQDISLLANSDQIARLVGGYLASPQTNEDAAAVQWAIWEITTEVLLSPSSTNGNVRMTLPANQATASLANLYLAGIHQFTPASLIYLTSESRQDMVTWTVPEPGAFGLAAFSALLLLRRRR